jgi:hypothetical protein
MSALQETDSLLKEYDYFGKQSLELQEMLSSEAGGTRKEYLKDLIKRTEIVQQKIYRELVYARQQVKREERYGNSICQQ